MSLSVEKDHIIVLCKPLPSISQIKSFIRLLAAEYYHVHSVCL